MGSARAGTMTARPSAQGHSLSSSARPNGPLLLIPDATLSPSRKSSPRAEVRGSGDVGEDVHHGFPERSGGCSSGWLSRCWRRACKHLKSLHQMFSCTSLPRSPKCAWFNCGYLQPKESGWQFAGRQGLISQPCFPFL